MTKIDKQHGARAGAGTSGLSYSAADRATWEPQIRAVQEDTFAAAGIAVAHHDREVAFHRAMGSVCHELAGHTGHTCSGEPLIPEWRIIDIATRSARATIYVRSRRFYLYRAAMVAAATALTATVLWHVDWLLSWFVNGFVIELPPTEQQVQGGEVLIRVASYGGWAVVLVSVVLTLAALMCSGLAGYTFFTRGGRATLNGQVDTAGVFGAISLIATLASVFVLSIAIGSIEWVRP
ncbi:hypothetical protein [Rhodococcus koreensis]|uniref:Uncharacterized protein n=1 Tax=Rhodococcus koreensis TaxID=99653 RepID=A0A1H4I577_9NOCA|nr:hypothetical protein [Rhodococcus koreensis]SEB29239.1 hypothetical protein SAMN04490239_0051 [Rhodococcus koreensis]